MGSKAKQIAEKKIAERKIITAQVRSDPLKNAPELDFDKKVLEEAEKHESTQGVLWEPAEPGYYRALKNLVIRAMVDNYGFRDDFWPAGKEAFVEEDEIFPHHFAVVGER